MSKRSALLSAFLIPVACAAALLAALATSLPALAGTVFTGGSYGYDISYPQKNGPYPSSSSSITFYFGIVGVTSGRAFSQNSYLSSEYKWVTGNNPKPLTPSLYMNLNYPVGSTASYGQTGPKGKCSPSDKACQAYNYGYNAAQDAYGYASSKGAKASTWWLDIETANSWSAKPALNDLVIQGAVDYLSGNSVTVGIYSNASTWKKIAGSFAPGLPNWVYGVPSLSAMPGYCASKYAFGGGTVAVTQYWNGTYDLDYACGQ